MRITTLVQLLICFSFSTGHCCLNEFRTQLGKKVTEVDPTVPGKYAQEMRRDGTLSQDMARDLRTAEVLYKASGNAKDYNDYGVQLAFAGRYTEALQVFESLEQQKPGTYETAANLGTVYELLGRDEDALRWIRKAVAIDPASHDSSEWIHVRILEENIKARGQADYFLTHPIIPLELGNAIMPDTNRYPKADLYRIWRALAYQLEERIILVPPKDPVVGQLLATYGDLTAIVSNVESAGESYQMAREYGHRSTLMDQRDRLFRQISDSGAGPAIRADNRKWEVRRRWAAGRDWYLAGGTLLLAGLVFAVVMWLRRRANRNA